MTERDVYLDGNPDVDSTRRHMERVLKGSPRNRRWWFAAALGGGSLWMLWRVGKGAARTPPTSDDRATARGTRPASATDRTQASTP